MRDVTAVDDPGRAGAGPGREPLPGGPAAVATPGEAVAGPGASGGRAPLPAAARAGDPLAELRFLHEILRLATTARTWEELLEIVVDATRDALGASVSSLYLLDRDGAHLTLAATNGLDRHQIGRARVPLGQGITGRVAASLAPLRVADVRADTRFLWVRGIDQRRFVASMLSVPLRWRDQVVGVLNVQTERRRDFSDAEERQLSAIGDLLAGIVEKGRLQQEAEAQVAQLRVLDRARTELIALVTHELRTPLAVVRAYTDLLAEEPPLEGRSSRDPGRRTLRASWHQGTVDQIERLDRLVDSILASVRIDPDQPADLQPVDLDAWLPVLVEDLRPLLRRHRTDLVPGAPARVLADTARLRQVLEHLLDNAVKYAPPGTRVALAWEAAADVVRLSVTDEGPGIPPEWRERVFEPYARRETRTARGAGIGLYAARRLAESMGGRLWCEAGTAGGAAFVLALPASRPE